MILPLSIESRQNLKPPLALITLIAVNIWFQAFFTFVHTFHLMEFKTFLDWFAFDPDKPTVSGIFLSMFTHAGWWHLISNMVFLWIFGWILEDRLGWKKFALLYLGCGLAGNLIELGIYWAAYALAPGRVSMPGIGASGCVMAIVGITLTRYFNLKVRILNPFVAPLIVWFLLMVFMPSWRSWLGTYFLFYLPLCYMLPYTARKMIYRVPLWSMALYFFVSDYFMVVKGEDDGVNHLIHAFCFISGFGAGWLMYLPQENVDERLLERAQEDARNGFTNAAVSEYVEYLEKYPENSDARCELADFYLQMEDRTRFRRQGYKDKAFLQYQWVLELWLKEGRELDAVKLFRSLRGTFRDEEYKPQLLAGIMKLGDKDKTLSMKAPDRRAALEEEVGRLYGNRQYPAALAALGEWWKLGNIEDADPAFLSLAADVFHRLGDGGKEELILEYLTNHGTQIQAARALHLLYKLWMGTPKQIQLKVVFRHALDRLPDLRLDHQLMELETKIE